MTIYDPLAGAQPDAIDQATSPDQNDPSAPLSGLLSGHTLTRKRAYLIYAGATLLVSFAPDVVVAGVLTGHEASTLTVWAALASSILLKVGVAFGFVAAANTGAP